MKTIEQHSPIDLSGACQAGVLPLVSIDRLIECSSKLRQQSVAECQKSASLKGAIQAELLHRR